MQVEERETVGDGRTRRRTRNMTAVLDAVIELAAGGDLDPTSETIAAVAGISHRSIYRYFENRVELFDAAVGRVVELIDDELFFEPAGEGSFDIRVECFVDARLAAQVHLSPVVRALAAHVGEPTALPALESLRDALRTQISLQFAEELGEFDPRIRRQLAALLDTMFQCEGIAALQRSLDNEHELREALSHMLRRTLSSRGAGPRR